MDDTLQPQPAPEVVKIEKEGEPLPEGVSRAPESEGEPVVSPHMLRVSQATKLADLADDYVFFTHGLLFTHARWATDPVVDHIREQYEKGKECEPFHIQLPRPAFRWFESKGPDGEVLDDQWNYQLCGIHKEQWEDLFAFLCTLSGINRDTKFFHTVVAQKVPVVDLLHLEKVAVLPDPVPYVDVICFALLTNRQTVYFAPENRREPWGPVPVMTRNGEPQVRKMARALFANMNRPMSGTVEPTQAEAEALIKGADVDAGSLHKGLHDPEKLRMTDADLVAKVRADDPYGPRLADVNLVQR